MVDSVLNLDDISTFEYIVTHVFYPLKLPDGDDHNVGNDRSLAGAIGAFAHLYSAHAKKANVPQWHSILRMLDNLRAVVQFQSLDRSQTISQLDNMLVGDVLAFLIRAQNAAVVFRKLQNVTVFESFEISPKAQNVMTTQGKLVCSYPGPAVEIPNVMFDDHNFLSELVNFLVHMNDDILPDAAATARKAKSTVTETRDTIHPRYITELLTGILRSVGSPADVVRISKRVGDDVVWNNSKLPWRRSPLWLLIRVVLQTTLQQSDSGLGRVAYKEFMLFFMCCLGKERICTDLPNDILQLMSAKISRRMRKLGPSAPDWLSSIALETCTSLRYTLEKRWEQVQAVQRVSPPWSPSKLDLSQDIQLSLSGSSGYILSSLSDDSVGPVDTDFTPRHRPRGDLNDFLSSDGVFFDEVYRSEPHVALYDVERAVEQGIDEWVNLVTKNDDACVQLEILANVYSLSALRTYGNNPEMLSVTLLTIIELWIALDKLAIREIPMLTDYSPEVPTSLLEDLLVTKAASLDRLRRAHQYISQRHSKSERGSVFSSKTTADTFAVRYYRGSQRLQDLKVRIEGAAQLEVDAKVAQLEKANARHAEVKQKCINTEHSSSVTQDGREFHPKKCVKCRLEKQLKRMDIGIYEWPLPAGNLAEIVVFELDCPVSFNMWRSATFHLLVDFCSPSLKPKDPYIKLDQYGPLQSYLVNHPRYRISLCSETKPFGATHYGRVSLPATKNRVCVNNGLKFSSFDCRARIPVSEALGRVNIRKYCTYQLQSGSYQSLQKYVDATSHTSNEVMANQFDCHKDLSIHEYTAFGHLRSGGSLQWLNVLRELRARSLTFRCQEVHSLIAQAVSQVGPLANTGWTWHQEVRQPSFCEALIDELEDLLKDVKANWLEGVTMDTITFLLRRVLASNPNQAVSEKAFSLLRAVRERVYSWVTDLSDKLAGSSGDEELRGLLRDTAAICRSTFNVAKPATTRDLLSFEEDIVILLSSAIFVHENTPGNVSSLSPHSQLLIDRDRRFSLALESRLSDILQTGAGSRCLDTAVSKVWPTYRPGSKWSQLQHPNSRWFSCATELTASQWSQTVHFNLLDGSLLVDGKPLGRLPHAIMEHPLYGQVFGTQVLNVVPSDLPGMEYATRDLISGHQVHFSLRNDDLVVRAKEVGSSFVHELVPPEKLIGDLPTVLISGHVHWLNFSTSLLEIRPFEKLWERSSGENWTIDCTPGRYRMRKGRELLIDVRSPSWAMVSSLLAPLDTSQNLLVTLSPTVSDQPSSLRLSVSLPRYGLSFYVDADGDLRSRNIRNMVYDKDQSTGTMFGLVNQLVLRPKSTRVNVDELVPRCVLIPEGDISFHMDNDHIRVEIDTQGSSRVTYQTYRVDTDLGCLTGNVSLTNKLYCAYLHALTSGCSVDPLTGKSGTEEALSLLRSSSCWSIMKFSLRDAELLGLIASLCPSRTWYPEQLRCMQRVEWLDLPASAQHHELFVVANGIKEHCERFQLFHEGQPSLLFESFPSRDDHLLKRGALRAGYLFPSELSGHIAGENYDIRYPGRDVVGSGSGEHRAYTAAATVHNVATGAATAKYVKDLMKSWEEKVTISGTVPLSLQYDRSWLCPHLPSIWLEAYNLLRESDDDEIGSQLFFSLPAMAYASPALGDLVPAFVAFAIDSRFCLEDPPDYDSYNLPEGYCPTPAVLRGLISSSARPFEQSPESTEPAVSGESFEKLRQRQLKLYKKRLESNTSATIHQLLLAWPCEIPPQCSLNPASYDVAKLTSDVENYFLSCHRNLKLKQHFARVQEILKGVHPRPVPNDVQYSFRPSQDDPPRVSWSPMVQQLFLRSAPSLRAPDKLPRYTAPAGNQSSPNVATLHKLITMAEADATNLFQLRYVAALRNSAESLESETPSQVVSYGGKKKPTVERLKAHYIQCRARCTQALEHIRMYLGPTNNSERALKQSGQWPRITPHALFRILASNSPIGLSDDWKKCLTKLALIMLELQRARRLLRLHLDGFHEEFFKDVENEGCDGWVAEEHPDWLLIQLQGNFLIRRVQVDVANEMISPHSGKNTAMQLNMGEGKSSVIVPISVAVLADGDQVVRVIVPKALTSQMFQLLVDRLGGLANRRIYFLPFSRSVEISPERISILCEILTECMNNRGILVVQPEHVLSLKLVTVEKQLSHAGDDEVPALLLELQKWLHSRSRDILDESDEILHVRYELVYTIGLQRHMEGFPERWTTTQQILDLVKKCAPSLRAKMPLGVEYERGQSTMGGSFPHFRILQADAGRRLVSWVVQKIMDDHLPNFNFGQLRPDIREAIRSFISYERISSAKLQLVKEYSQESHLWGGLLLLRGLLVTGILLFAFRERRWRVDYGLAPTRTMLAVPYRAKDVPAQRAEFGHPDVAILLTCLSYYYGGLDEGQLKACIEILLKQDDPSVDYELWVRECPSVPESLHSLSGINIKSTEQWRNLLIPLFSRNKATIDFYLSRVVFPREAKEFPSKLSCSGWDLAEKRTRLLTGFSGTNDGQYLLPLDITQHDPRHQRGTNAKVLAYLLQPENNHYKCTTHDGGTRRTTREFLEILAAQNPAIHVLLDVGAQMLDLQNRELAEAWLAVSPNSSAAIYFSEDDELTVLTRDGGTQLLLSSPFATQLEQCVIYLDDVHTRGTDINFPSGFRAAVTLGPGVTKDRLAQGCMRMRKLGHGHSIMFFAPLEVDRRIRYVAGKGPLSEISAVDILQWAIRETCDDIQQRAPHWAQQGMDHASRNNVWSSFSKGTLSSDELSSKWLKPEAKKLEDLYGPRGPFSPAFLASPAIRRRCVDLGVVSSLRTVSMDEEQEREVVHEAERERQVERPPRVPPAIHCLHQDVISFVRTGIIPPNSKAFRPAFNTLDATSAASNEAYVWSPSVLATIDFEKTINSSKRVDDYMRPVQWVVSVKKAQKKVLVILSPYEVNNLMPFIRFNDSVHLHPYTPRVTKSMKPCDDLELCSIPAVVRGAGWSTPSPHLIDQLNVFAGQLYLRDYETYIRLCRFLCVYAKDLEYEEGIEVEGDGFIAPKDRPRWLQAAALAQAHTFQTTPLDSLRVLMGLRRKGAHFAPTHMGRLVDGLTLSERDFAEGSDPDDDDDDGLVEEGQR